MDKKEEINWFPEAQEHDYPAAVSYLSLLYDEDKAEKLAKRLRKAAMSSFKAKDIFRASRLPLLDETNYHVQQNRTKILKGEKLSPLLLIRNLEKGRLVIADGYHRMCAVYTFDEDAVIPAKIASDE